MLDAKQVYEAKVQRLAREGSEADIAFLVTLLTCGGMAYRKYGTPQGFADFVYKYGDNGFNMVKERLAGSGLIMDNSEALVVNQPGFAELSMEQRETVASELSELLFQHGRQFFEQVISTITRTAEGRYALSELAKAGPNLGEETIGHVRQVIGWDSWQSLNEPFGGTGLLVHTWSSKKHDYY